MAPKKGQHTKPAAERKGRPVVIRLTELEHAALKRIARRHKLPVTHFIREGIRLLIEREGR